MRIVGSIQARLGSTRLPGKVLKPIAGKPMLLWQVERLRRSRLLDTVVVATTTNPNDDAIVDFCKTYGIPFYRGSENDVLNRIASLVKEFSADIHVEFYGDSPLTDPHLIDEFIGYFLKSGSDFDYVSNTLECTYPSGQEVVVYRGAVLQDVDSFVAQDDPLREHCGYNITRFPERYRMKNLTAPDYYAFPDIYLEVDTEEDFAMMQSLYGHFADKGVEHFSLAQILDLMEHDPDLFKSNAHVVRRWKELKKANNV